jgi:hypothetical protein
LPGSRKRVRARCIPGPLLRIARVSGQTVKTCYGKRSSQKESYEMNLKLKSVLLVAGLCLSAQATVVYQDDFTGVAGSLLNGRAPDTVNTGGNVYTASTALKLSTNASATGWAISTNGAGYAAIAMPTLTVNDTVIMTAVLRPRNSSANNWMGFGLQSADTNGVGTIGTAWAYLRGGVRLNEGQVAIFSGPGAVSNTYTTVTTPESGYQGINPSTMKITYAVSNGYMKVELGANTVWDGLIDYGGVDTPAPLTAIDHFGFAWNSQLTDTSTTPGYFDSIKVEVIPEGVVERKLTLFIVH